MALTQQSPTPQATFDRLITAVRANDLAGFLADATSDMAESVTPALMDFIHGDLAPHLDAGFQAAYLCNMKQHGFTVHLWKLVFADGADDVVLRIVQSGDQLAGFYRQ